jgi:hypothetical protein
MKAKLRVLRRKQSIAVVIKQNRNHRNVATITNQTINPHLESCTPGQDQAKSYVPVCTDTYWYVLVH